MQARRGREVAVCGAGGPAGGQRMRWAATLRSGDGVVVSDLPDTVWRVGPDFADSVCGIGQSFDFKTNVGVELVTVCDQFGPSSPAGTMRGQGRKRAEIG
jgi:hypothetical protein